MDPGDLLTILMPCKDQKDNFLAAAIGSVLRQTSPHWRLLVIVEHDTPAAVTDRITSFADERIRVIVNQGWKLGGALNTGMRAAESDFVSILLSDDALDARAVATVMRYVWRYPHVDFFYSSRRYIDGQGQLRGPVMRSDRRFTLDHFHTRGSPVKHLLSWRRAKGLEVGGMDEHFSAHGCDDMDFPWTMAEAGARFMAIRACLYHYRNHEDFFRLTTHTPVEEQVNVVTAMFRKHRVPEPAVSRYLRSALDSYLLPDATASYRAGKPLPLALSCHGEFTPDRAGDFLVQGYQQRHFFPHRVYFIPKGGPDGLKLASRMCGVNDPSRLHEIVLFASPPAIDEFPDRLFFDDDLIWHQQQFGRKGQIATANVVLDGEQMFGMAYVSDLVQRISRQRQYKTRVEKLFQGWSRLLINALLVFAVENGVQTFFSATAELALRNTDPKRHPEGRLFTRVYDHHLREILDADRQGEWWRIDVPRNRHRVVLPEKRRELVDAGRTICLCHDIERGMGHLQSDPDFARSVEGPAQKALAAMLDLEEQAGVRCTYNIVGKLFDELREVIACRGHAVAFHSYDHQLSGSSEKSGQHGPESFQLEACRLIDYRIKGYRPPQSRMTDDLSDPCLSFSNFEWLASSQGSLGCTVPHLENGIVKIPIHFDDFDLYTRKQTCDEWFRRAVQTIEENDFTAFSLHDCYAGFWLEQYADFLASIRGLGEFQTLDEVAARIFLCGSL